MPEATSFITASEFGLRLGKSRNWGLLAARQGLVPSIKVGHIYLISEADVANIDAVPVVCRQDLWERRQKARRAGKAKSANTTSNTP